MNTKMFSRGLLCMTAAALVSSCGTGEWLNQSPLTLRLADGPVDEAFAVVITVTGFEIIDESSIYDYEIPLRPPLQVDLLAQADGRSVVLVDRLQWVSDRYDGLRLMIRADSNGEYAWIDTPTGRHALYMPDGYGGRLRMKQELHIPASGEADYTIDFDLRQSILPPAVPGAPYLLDPVLRLVNTFEAGMIRGVVAAATAGAPGCVPVVYAFAGSSITPDDIDRIAPEPPTEGTARLDPASGEYRYVLAHMPPGQYTIALTCQGDLDVPNRNELSAISSVVTFGAPVQVTVPVGAEVEVNLP
jgi:hypothetical protein